MRMSCAWKRSWGCNQGDQRVRGKKVFDRGANPHKFGRHAEGKGKEGGRKSCASEQAGAWCTCPHMNECMDIGTD